MAEEKSRRAFCGTTITTARAPDSDGLENWSSECLRAVVTSPKI